MTVVASLSSANSKEEGVYVWGGEGGGSRPQHLSGGLRAGWYTG